MLAACRLDPMTGYAAFWQAVGLHTLQSGPRLFWNGVDADGWALGRMVAYSLIGFVTITLLLSALPMVDFYSRAQNSLRFTLLLLPQAIPLSIPIALPLAIVCSVYDARLSARRILAVLLVAILRRCLPSRPC